MSSSPSSSRLEIFPSAHTPSSFGSPTPSPSAFSPIAPASTISLPKGAKGSKNRADIAYSDDFTKGYFRFKDKWHFVEVAKVDSSGTIIQNNTTQSTKRILKTAAKGMLEVYTKWSMEKGGFTPGESLLTNIDNQLELKEIGKGANADKNLSYDSREESAKLNNNIADVNPMYQSSDQGKKTNSIETIRDVHDYAMQAFNLDRSHSSSSSSSSPFRSRQHQRPRRRRQPHRPHSPSSSSISNSSLSDFKPSVSSSSNAHGGIHTCPLPSDSESEESFSNQSPSTSQTSHGQLLAFNFRKVNTKQPPQKPPRHQSTNLPLPHLTASSSSSSSNSDSELYESFTPGYPHSSSSSSSLTSNASSPDGNEEIFNQTTPKINMNLLHSAVAKKQHKNDEQLTDQEKVAWDTWLDYCRKCKASRKPSSNSIPQELNTLEYHLKFNLNKRGYNLGNAELIVSKALGEIKSPEIDQASDAFFLTPKHNNQHRHSLGNP